MGLNPAGGHGYLSFVSVACYRADHSSRGSPTECGVSNECNHEAPVAPG